MEFGSHTVETDTDSGINAHAASGSRAEKREVQVQRILDASRKCFVRSGFRGTSMHEICGEAGMSPGALYRYFPSKESIIEAISESHRREELAILATMSNGPTIIDGFMSAIMAHLRHVHATGMGPLFTEIRAESLRNETVRNCCQKSESQFIEAFANFIETATSQGLINPVVGNDVLIPVMMAVGEGIIFSNLPEQGVDAERLEPMLRHLTESFLRPVASIAPVPQQRKKEA
jgi:TetR/AcrR family transcriptional regulator, repressor for uid operon